MHPGVVRGGRIARLALPIAVAAALVMGVGGCATGAGSHAGAAPAEVTTYAGVFTGEFLDGMPLYRFPPIYVVGSRRGVAPDM